MICLTVLSLAVTGVLAGCRSLTAIWEHTTDLTAADLEALGLQVGQALASESTIRRVLQDLDPTNLDAHVRSWLCTRSGTIEGRTVIAVDGKTMRAARTGKDPAPHLLAALDQATGTVLAQARVADKSNEIPALRELLKPLDLDGVVVSADAMHTQTDAAEWTRPAGRSLRAHASGQSEDPAQDTQEAALTRTSRPPPGATSLTGDECGAPPEATWAPTWVDFPGAAQVLQVRRTRTTKDRRSTGNNGGDSAKRTTVEVVYPGLLPTHGTGSTRAGCRLGPGTLEDRQPAPRRSVTWSRARTTTSYAPPTAPRTWPP